MKQTGYLTSAVLFRDVNKTVKSQAVESARAEERLLNMDFVTAKAKELGRRRERAEVFFFIFFFIFFIWLFYFYLFI